MKLKMNNVEYEIREVSQKEYKQYRKEEDRMTGCEETDTTKDVFFGASHYYPCIIFIDKDLSIDRKRKVLIHELTHCYISEYVSHEEKKYNEEDVADIVSNSHDIIHKIIENYFNKK